MSVEKALLLPTPGGRKFTAAGSMRAMRVCWRWLTGHLWVMLPLLAVPALWPFYQEGLLRSFDGGLHLLRLGVLDYHIRQGAFYPRWSPTLMLGYGYPVFNFYAPSTYYLAELLHLLGFSFYTAFLLSFALLILLAGFGMWCFARESFGAAQPWATLVAAIAYMYGPYLFMNVFISGALAASGAQALLPWIFWSIRRLLGAKQPALYVLPVALTLGGLAVTHNLTLIFLPPLLIIYITIRWWQLGRNFSALRWMVLALAMAMGVSAFFWLPLLVEQAYLADTVRIISETALLPRSFWTWHNFLDWGFTYSHNFDRPIRLGLVQVALGVLGFVLARRRDAEWLFWGGVALFTSLLMGSWALPLWLNNPVLSVTQFPWRLLAVTSLPLALFAGGIVPKIWSERRVSGQACHDDMAPRVGASLTAYPTAWWQVGSALVLLGVIIFAQQPRLSWMDVFAPSGTDVTLPVFAQVEVDKGILGGGEGNSSIQEFRPRWVDRNLVLAPPSEQTAPKLKVQLERGNAYDLAFQVTNGAGGPLRFNNFYFPGWQVLLDGHTALKPYPSTNLGLLTVDLPTGDHAVALRWTGTPVQSWADALSLFTLGGLAWLAWRQRTWRWLSVIPGLLLIFGATAFVWPRQWTPIESPTHTVATAGIRFLGLRTEQPDATHLYLYPYWYVERLPSKNLRVQWQLLDAQGRVQTETLAYPYFNTAHASNWPPGTLVDDAYVLALPPDLPAGGYQIAVQWGTKASEWTQPAQPVGHFTLAKALPGLAPPPHPLQVQVGNAIQLTGFSATVGGQPLAFTAGKPTVVPSGAYLRYTLDWQATAPVDKNYHGFVHLTDSNGWPLVQEDQLPGPFFRPPLLWDRYYPQGDVYLLRIPRDAPSGLYWPEVGMYDFEKQDRLPVRTESQATPDDHYRLPPVKIVNQQAHEPTKHLTARFGDMAALLGYDLALPAAGLYPGEHFAITLYYRSEAATGADYTRFLHVYNAASGMAAQFDSPPQKGANPTWSWTPGEVIVDRVDLQVAAAAKPGQYTVYLGFYDPKTGGARIQARDAEGKPFPDDRVHVTDIEIRKK